MLASPLRPPISAAVRSPLRPGVGRAPGRAAPAGVPSLPMALTSAGGLGACVTTHGTNAITAALAANAGIVNAGVLYLKPSTGSDANNGLTEGAPVATLSRALRTLATGSRIVCLEDCVLPPTDLRNTDASQATQQFKWLDANGFNVILRDAGSDLTTPTWVQDGTLTNCYRCDLSTVGLLAGQTVTRVLRTDILDSYGFHTQFRRYDSAAALNTAGAGEPNGYFWDNAGRVLWLNVAAGNANTIKAAFRAMYTNTGGTSRVLVIGASIGFSGVRFEGAQFAMIDGGGRRPQLWLHNCTQLWSLTRGFDPSNCGDYITTDFLCYASVQDGANGFSPSATGPGLIFTVNSRFVKSGDVNVFAANGTFQGISAHGGTNHVSWGTDFALNNGQSVADTCINSTANTTWLVNCRSNMGGTVLGSPGAYSFGSVAASASRTAWLDTCTSIAPDGPDVMLSANGVCNTYNCPGFTVSGGSMGSYTPTFT